MSERYKVSGKAFELKPPTSEWKIERRPGGWLLAVGPRGERVRFAAEEQGPRFSVLLEGSLFHGELAASARDASGGGAGGESDLTAQFPGKVRKILVTAGQDVRAGQGLLLVEAMKMEFTIRSPYDGKVSKILVQEGQQLSPGARFLEVEPAKKAKA